MPATRIVNRVFNPGAVRVLNHIEELAQNLSFDAELVIGPYINLIERGFTVHFNEVGGRTNSVRYSELPMVGFAESRYSDPDKHIVVYFGMYDDFDKHGTPTEEVWEDQEHYVNESEAAHMILVFLIVQHPNIDNDLLESLDN